MIFAIYRAREFCHWFLVGMSFARGWVRSHHLWVFRLLGVGTLYAMVEYKHLERINVHAKQRKPRADDIPMWMDLVFLQKILA